MRPRNAFSLQIRLGAVPAGHTVVRERIGDLLDHFQPRLREHGPELELTLEVPAADLWHAVLLAMNAVTNLGFQATRLEAQSVAPPNHQRR